MNKWKAFICKSMMFLKLDSKLMWGNATHFMPFEFQKVIEVEDYGEDNDITLK